jgi:hypothetical protein
VPIYHPGDLYKIGKQYCALKAYVHGDQSHNQYEAEENPQSNGKLGTNLLDEVVVLEKQTCQFPDHCSQQGGGRHELVSGVSVSVNIFRCSHILNFRFVSGKPP